MFVSYILRSHAYLIADLFQEQQWHLYYHLQTHAGKWVKESGTKIYTRTMMNNNNLMIFPGPLFGLYIVAYNVMKSLKDDLDNIVHVN